MERSCQARDWRKYCRSKIDSKLIHSTCDWMARKVDQVKDGEIQYADELGFQERMERYADELGLQERTYKFARYKFDCHIGLPLVLSGRLELTRITYCYIY